VVSSVAILVAAPAPIPVFFSWSTCACSWCL
jgi:hypothetical protein